MSGPAPRVAFLILMKTLAFRTMSKTGYAVDLVVPCFNEEAIIERSVYVIHEKMSSYVEDASFGLKTFRLILVDDGSKDATWSLIEHLRQTATNIVGIKLSRNFGHQAALMAGLAQVESDACVSLDADLQDDIDAVGEMLRSFESGHEICLGVRSDRQTDTGLKRGTAAAYYRVLSLLGVRIVENHADFRLMSRKALRALLNYHESNLFLRGIVPALGFKTAIIPYFRRPRLGGETKYSLRKMLSLAVDGVTSFSAMPLRLVAVVGAIVFLMTLMIAAYVLTIKLLDPVQTVPGWASTVLPLVMIGGLQILSVGVVGEYVGKIYIEVKRRPRFIIEEKRGAKQQSNPTGEAAEVE
jgi:polyisoprenyl-phosphate glycosyltransferase